MSRNTSYISTDKNMIQQLAPLPYYLWQGETIRQLFGMLTHATAHILIRHQLTKGRGQTLYVAHSFHKNAILVVLYDFRRPTLAIE